ncbi:hypothetical protein pb186bvf_003125 [Paramecium bursaria]
MITHTKSQITKQFINKMQLFLMELTNYFYYKSLSKKIIIENQTLLQLKLYQITYRTLIKIFNCQFGVYQIKDLFILFDIKSYKIRQLSSIILFILGLIHNRIIEQQYQINQITSVILQTFICHQTY